VGAAGGRGATTIINYWPPAVNPRAMIAAQARLEQANGATWQGGVV
jgi:hypothetical protein